MRHPGALYLVMSGAKGQKGKNGIETEAKAGLPSPMDWENALKRFCPVPEKLTSRAFDPSITW